MTTYTPDMVVSVRQFTRQSDGDDVVIGNVETGSFLAVPPQAVEVLDYLAAGTTIAHTRDLYFTKYGEVLDIDDFLGIMEAKGFILSTDSADNDFKEPLSLPDQPATIRYHLATFPQSLASLIYSPPVLAIGLIISLSAAYALAIDRPLMPRATDLVFPGHRVASFLLFLTIALGSILLHELSHVIATRALGVNSRLGIGHRLWFVVAEADITGLWGVPKRRRYLPLLAGMVTDIVSAAVLILMLFARDYHWIDFSDFIMRLFRALVLSYWLRIVWQFYVFVRTDIYFVVTNFFGCKNLLTDTEDFLRNLISPLFQFIRVVDQSNIPASELRIIRAYSALWVVGRLLALYVLFAVTLPVGFSYARNLSHALQVGSSSSIYNFVDSLLLSSFFLISLAAGMFLWLRGIIRREKA